MSKKTPTIHEQFTTLAKSVFSHFDYDLTTYPPVFEKDDGTQAAIVCSQNCPSCCHIEVGLTFTELVGVVDFIDQCKKRELPKIKKAVKETKNLIGNNWKDDRKKLGLLCPLIDGNCMIYEARPLSCRAWFSSDKKKCQVDFNFPASEVAVNQSKLTFEMLTQTYYPQIQEKEHFFGFPTAGFELIRALHVALTTRNFTAKAHKKPSLLQKAVLPEARNQNGW